jgi:hypothetical protein
MTAAQSIFPFSLFMPVPYQGSVQSFPIARVQQSAATGPIRPDQQQQIVQTQMDFLNTYRGQAVNINLQSNTPAGSPLSQIAMVYVNNELNNQDLSIYFPDTQQLIGIPAFTSGYYPVMTGQLKATVYNGETGQVPVAQSSLCQIIFCNFMIPGFLSEFAVSVNFNSSSGLIIPSIGDTTAVVSANIVGSEPEVTTNILPTIALPEQYVITAINVALFQFYSNAPLASTQNNSVSVELIDDATNKLIRSWTAVAPNDLSFYNSFVLDSETGLNIPCQNLTMKTFINSAATGFVNANITFAQVTI